MVQRRRANNIRTNNGKLDLLIQDRISTAMLPVWLFFGFSYRDWQSSLATYSAALDDIKKSIGKEIWIALPYASEVRAGVEMGDYQRFIQSIYHKTAIDLSLYKEAQMKRRLKALYERKGFNSFDGYYKAIQQDATELAIFLDRLTINVSAFYRNKERWDTLHRAILPHLLSSTKRPKIWSAACSTGEEPYSLAMALAEYIPLREISILATDIDASVLARAQVGLYSSRAIQDLPRALKSRYFINEGAYYQVTADLQKTVTFKQHNLLSEGFQTGYDLIVCRNAMIYFTEEAKIMLYHKFAKALKVGGMLFVGSTEQIFNPEAYGLQPFAPFFYEKVSA